MGQRSRIIPNSKGVDYIHLDVDRGVQGKINIPCFYLDSEPFAAPTAWLTVKYPTSRKSRRRAAAALRDFLNEVLDGMRDKDRKKVRHDFWKRINGDIVRGYFHGVLKEIREQKKTSILNARALIQSFYEAAHAKGWCTENKTHLFEGLADIEEETEIDLHSQYLEDGLYETLLKQLRTKYPDKAEKSKRDRKLNERRRFYRARDRLVMELGHKGGLRSFEVTSLKVEQVLPLLEAVAKNGKITRHIKVSLIRKGGKLKDLDISEHLGQQIYNFIRYERKTRLKNVHHRSATDRAGPLICSEAGNSLRDAHGTHVFRLLRRLALIEDIPKLLERVEKKETPGWWLPLRQIAGDGSPKTALSFHALRHTYLTDLAIDCVDPDYVRQQAGHATKDTTYELYVEFGVKLVKARSDRPAQGAD